MSDTMLAASLFELMKLGLITWWNYSLSQGMTEAELDSQLSILREQFLASDPNNLPRVEDSINASER